MREKMNKKFVSLFGFDLGSVNKGVWISGSGPGEVWNGELVTGQCLCTAARSENHLPSFREEKKHFYEHRRATAAMSPL